MWQGKMAVSAASPLSSGSLYFQLLIFSWLLWLSFSWILVISTSGFWDFLSQLLGVSLSL